MHINHLGISGGKDSTALLLWAVHESGYPLESLRVSFCDTGNENPLTYDYVRMLSERVFPIEWLTPERTFLELAQFKKRFPSSQARFCTEMLKLLPTKRHIEGMLAEGHTVLLHSGVRASESADRAKLSERSVDSYIGEPVYRPLLRWQIEDVWAIHARYGIPPNPLYAMGFKRVGCFPCVMSRKGEVRRIARLFPERIDELREWERSIHNRCGYSSIFPRTTVPISQRSRPIVAKSGEVMRVATIDDVVRWSRTSRGGQQYDMEFDDEGGACAHESGLCE